MKSIIPLLLSTPCVISSTTPQNPEAALAGPAYPSPSQLSSSSLLPSAITTFKDLLASSAAIQANETAWSVALFSTHDDDDEPLYEQYFTPDYNISVTSVDRDSIFRIASVSKVFSVWSFLIEVGDEYWSHPVTRYVPELKHALDSVTLGVQAEQGVLYDDIDHVRWDEVTLGQLASHLAGIPRDPAETDLSAALQPDQLATFGLPTLNQSQVPHCGVTGIQRPCSRKETIAQLLRQHPIFPTGHSPAYTNTAFALLAFAQESITGNPIHNAITSNLFQPLHMLNSSFSSPPTSGGVIPGGDAHAVSWDWDLGTMAPAGSIYASTSDLMRAGRGILDSKLLTPAQTRRWLKPMSATGVTSSTVGAPWEIRQLALVPDGCHPRSQRISQIYTKQGDLGGYRAALILSPEHDLGAVVFSAGTLASNSALVRETLMNAVGDAFLPMAERQARKEAEQNFAGVYVDRETNSTLIVKVDASGSPGLQVPSLTSRGATVIGPSSAFIQIYNAGQSARLFPSSLRSVRRKASGEGEYVSRLGFRASFFNATAEGKIQDPGLLQWTSLGAPAYGGVTLDDWVFELGEDGKAMVVDVRMLRLKMEKV